MKQEITKKEDQKNGCGECIFCLTQCPECGSRNINVMFKPEFDYTYEEGSGFIDISNCDATIEIQCEECDHWQVTSDSSLIWILRDILDFPSGVHVSKNDKYIEIQRYDLVR